MSYEETGAEQEEKRLKYDKLKQVVALVGGFLSAVYFFLLSVGVKFDWFNPETIGTFEAVLTSAIPLALLCYGLYKNTYLLREKARKQEEVLIKKGLK